MDSPNSAIIYFSQKSIIHKKLSPISKKEIYNAFGRKDLLIFTDSKKLEKHLRSLDWENKNLLMMSSGTFSGLKMDHLID